MEKARKGFRQLTVWQKAYLFTVDIYKLPKKCPKEELYGLASQLRRAAVSVPANINIAEGYERNHHKEYLQFLYIAKGSLGEVETYLLLAKDLGYMTETDYSIMEDKRNEVARTLLGLVRSLP
jgi:four helix bundle protein